MEGREIERLEGAKRLGRIVTVVTVRALHFSASGPCQHCIRPYRPDICRLPGSSSFILRQPCVASFLRSDQASFDVYLNTQIREYFL